MSGKHTGKGSTELSLDEMKNITAGPDTETDDTGGACDIRRPEECEDD